MGERAADPARDRRGVAEHVAFARRLDLDHLGAAVGQQAAAPRSGHQRAQVDHADPGERAEVVFHGSAGY
jgi:hypothetical protein